jgi:hypothetical protein
MVDGESTEPVRREAMVSLNGNGQPRPLIDIPPEGTLERLLYDMDGLFGLVVEYKGKKKGRTFSTEGIEGVVEGFQSYVYAQIARRWNETREAPTKMTIRLDIEWEIDDEDTDCLGSIFIGEGNDE